MTAQYRKTTAFIHMDSLEHNLRELKKLAAPGAFFCPMVKANGYGHGDVAISLKLEQLGVQNLGVALIEEGLVLRRAGCRSKILYFGIFDEDGIEPMLQAHLTPVLSTWEQVHLLEKKVKSPLAVHLKFDTGMHRLGFPMNDIQKLYEHMEKSVLKVEGVLTHLHSGEGLNPKEGSALEQLRKFARVEKTFVAMRPIAHSLNSSGLINFARFRDEKWPEGLSLHQGTRPGLALYGSNPVPGSAVKLKPVMSLRTQIARALFVPAGETVSYGATWKAQKDSVIAVLPLGYADGYHRLLSNRSEVLFRGERVPVAGTVCMDYTMIDLTPVLKNETADSIGHESVTLFGQDEKGHQISADEVARFAQTVSWEVFTSVSGRVPRVVEDGEGL
jgi:alanine racemase